MSLHRKHFSTTDFAPYCIFMTAAGKFRAIQLGGENGLVPVNAFV